MTDDKEWPIRTEPVLLYTQPVHSPDVGREGEIQFRRVVYEFLEHYKQGPSIRATRAYHQWRQYIQGEWTEWCTLPWNRELSG